MQRALKSTITPSEPVTVHQADTRGSNTPCLENWGHFYFLNNFVKHKPILIIFGTQYHKETCTNAEFVVWLFTTMNLYVVTIASAQK